MNTASRRQSSPATLLTLVKSLTPKDEEKNGSIWTTKHLNSKGTPDRRFKENRTLTVADIDLLSGLSDKSEEPMVILAKHGRNIHISPASPSGVRRKVGATDLLKAQG